MGKKRTVSEVGAAFRACRDQGGAPDELLESLDKLARYDELYDACVQLTRAGNLDRVSALLDDISPPEPDIATVRETGGSKAALGFAVWSSLVWACVVSTLWIVDPPLWGIAIAMGVGWAFSFAALRSGGAVASRIYPHYSALDDLGALVFLAVPPMTIIGFIWMVARAIRVRGGHVTGPGRGTPATGGGYSSFEQGNIGAAGRPLALTLLALAVGHTGSLALTIYLNAEAIGSALP